MIVTGWILKNDQPRFFLKPFYLLIWDDREALATICATQKYLVLMHLISLKQI